MKSDITIELTEEELKKVVLQWYFGKDSYDKDKFEAFWYINDAGQDTFKIVGKL